MSVLESLISVVGTLAGVLAGALITLYSERRRQRHEEVREYRRELKTHMDDLIGPLFVSIQNLWGSLGILQTFLNREGVKAEDLSNLLPRVQSDNKALSDFVGSRYELMSLLLPSPFPWVFTPIYELINNRVVEPISKGEKPMEQITLAVNKLMAVQKNLRKLLGYDMDIEMEKVYPF